MNVNLGLNDLELQINVPVIVINNLIPDYDDYNFMPNSFFKRSSEEYDNERELYGVLQMEGFNNFGTKLRYFVVSFDIEYNKIWGEDNNRTVLSAFDIMSYFDLPQETEMFTQFGIEGIDTFHIYINKMHFDKVTNGTGIYNNFSGYKPKIGDIIQAKYNGYYYEIVDVNHTEQMFLQFKHCWDLIVKPMKIEHLSSNV